MKTILISVVLALVVALALTAPPASAQVSWTKAIDDTVEGAEAVYSGWYEHNLNVVKTHTKATQANDSIKAAVYIQFGRGSSADTTVRVLLDSVIAAGTKLFSNTAYGDRVRYIWVGKHRNAEGGTCNNLEIWFDRRPYGR